MKYIFLISAEFMLLSLLAVRSCSQEEMTSGQAICPIATCADPIYRSDNSSDTICPSCESSLCKFRGCVHFGPFGPIWLPDNCTFCGCYRGEEFCNVFECPEKNCYGYPLVNITGKCCPECDYGIKKNECGVIPQGERSLYVALGDFSCQHEVIKYGCDKRFINSEDGKRYACYPILKEKILPLKGCRAGVKRVVYEDVAECEKREIGLSRVPQDPNPTKCSLYVEP